MASRRAVRSPSGRDKALAPIRPNAGLRVAYQRRLEALVEALHKSLSRWLVAAYRRSPPEMAGDASPAMEIRKTMRRLGRRWLRRFDKAAPELAAWFAQAASERSDAQLKSILKQAGIAIEFKLTPEANDVLQATVGQNVALIRSIAQTHLNEVEQGVMRAVQAGGDLGALTKMLNERYAVSRSRAGIIAKHQVSLANAQMTKERQLQCGIKEAIWMHSGGGHRPRPNHVKAGRDKLRYEIAKGAFIDGAWIQPGELINCRCLGKPILPGLDT